MTIGVLGGRRVEIATLHPALQDYARNDTWPLRPRLNEGKGGGIDKRGKGW